MICVATGFTCVSKYAFRLRRTQFFVCECKAVNIGKNNIIVLTLRYFQKFKIQLGAPGWVFEMDVIF